jgi:hypothetical protein
VILLMLACSGQCQVDEDLDYSQDETWICKPGRDDLCSEPISGVNVETNGSVSDFEVPASQEHGVDCFFVYPTMDLRLRLDLDTDLEEPQGPETAVRAQFAHFRQVCNTWTPVYRQATIGAYFKDPERAEACFETAYTDIEQAWSQYLRESDKPFVLIGHSQGAQHSYQLIHEQITADPALQARLVAAYPVGAPVADDSPLPTCKDDAEWGCQYPYRSYAEGNDIPDFSGGEGLECLHPDQPAVQGWAPLERVMLLADKQLELPEGLEADPELFLAYDNAFEARCVTEGTLSALEVRWSADDDRIAPYDPGERDIRGNSGTHILDMSFGQYGLMADIQRRTSSSETR